MTTASPAAQPAAPHDIAQEKIKFGEKFSYLLLVMCPNPLLNLASTYLMIFYTDIVGLNPIAIGTLFLISRIMDAFSDPIMGYLIDHMPRTKMGKYRYVMIGGTIICTINFVLLWFGPVWATSGKLAIAYITYLVLGFTFDMMDVPKNSMLPAMTASNKERSSLGMLMAFGTVFSSVLVSIAAPIILSKGDMSLSAFSSLILVVAGVVVVFGVVGGLGVKERVIPAGDDEAKHSVKDYVKILIQRPVLANLAFGFLFSAGIYINSGVNAYFYRYVMKDLALLSTVSLSQVAGLLPGIFLAGLISKKLGKKRTLIITGLAMAVLYGLRWIDPTSVPLIYLVTIAGGFMLGVFQPVGQVINADNIDYAEYKMNYRSEAAIASTSSFIAKFANGIAGAIPGYVLGWVGYVAASQQQPASVLNAIVIVSIGIPIIFFILSGVIFGLGYNVSSSQLEEVEIELSKRRAAKLAQTK